MADSIIPDDIKQFILQHIDSIAQLEGLLMLRADPQKRWDAEAAAHGLYISEAQATALLTHLLERGFIIAASTTPPLQYQYRPKSPELKAMTDRIAQMYRQCLVPITNLIHAKSKNRIQEFANAFKIRKD